MPDSDASFIGESGTRGSCVTVRVARASGIPQDVDYASLRGLLAAREQVLVRP